LNLDCQWPVEWVEQEQCPGWHLRSGDSFSFELICQNNSLKYQTAKTAWDA